MAESDRQRLLARALALPQAAAGDFAGGRSAPRDANPELLKRIDDTGLRTKLLAVGLGEGLQSPKGPQRIASILRIYPEFNAPAQRATNGRPPNGRAMRKERATPRRAGLPSIAAMERLVARYREVERDVTHELSAQYDDRIVALKRALTDLEGEALETAYRELGVALERKRALDTQIRAETFRRLESDASFSERGYLQLLAR